MLVYREGTPVTIKAGEIEGFIVGILLKNKSVQYEVSFFDGEIKSTWLGDIEFTTEGKKSKIGFKYFQRHSI